PAGGSRPEGVPAELPRVLRAAVVPTRRGGPLTGNRAPRRARAVRQRPPRPDAPPARLLFPHGHLRAPVGAGTAEHDRGALRRDRPREPLGVERDGPEVRVPATAGRL